MSGETKLDVLLCKMTPELLPQEYVFYSTCALDWQHVVELDPIGAFVESEGISVIVSREQALHHKIPFSQTYQCITLNIHSSLDAVGLTAAVSTALAKVNISANVVAAYYHDHIFVNSKDAHSAMSELTKLTHSNAMAQQ